MRACNTRFAWWCRNSTRGSMSQVLLCCAASAARSPLHVRARRDGRRNGRPPPTRVHGIITNPFLAGAYMYGRSQTRTTIVDGRIRRASGNALTVDAWHVVISNHHPGPLGWASYRRHLSMIESNAYMKPRRTQAPTRRPEPPGGALLRCQRCGHTLQVCYSGRDARAPSIAACVAIISPRLRRPCPWQKAVQAAITAQLLQAIETEDHRRLDRSRASRRRPASSGA
jgi:hypothetical protein